MSSLVNGSAIPYTDVNCDTIRGGASSLRTAAAGVRDGGAEVVSAWRPIAGVYEGPGDQALFDAMTPVGTDSTRFGDDLDAVAAAITAFADEVEPIVARLKAYRSAAGSLASKVRAFEPHEKWSWMALGNVSVDSWDQDEALNDENNRIVNGVAAEVVEYEAAERRCANSIRALAGMAPLHAMTGAEDDPLGYGYDALPAGTKLPWGQSGDRQESCSEKTGTFVPGLLKGIVVDGVGGTLAGLGQMVGFGGSDGSFWSWNTVSSTWGAMGGLISYNSETGHWGDWGHAGDSWTGLGKGTIAWDEWAKDPGTALGTSIFNVGSLLIPVVGEAGKVGAAGRVGEVAGGAGNGAKVARVIDFTDASSLVARGAHVVLPKLSDLAASIGDRFGGLKTLLSDHMPHFKDGHFHFDGAHAEPDVPAARPEPAGPHMEQPVHEPALVADHSGGGHGGGYAGEHGGGGDGTGSNGAGGQEGGGSGHHDGGAQPVHVVDSSGRDISEIVGESTLGRQELQHYLSTVDPSAAEAFARDGVWPEGVQVPKGASVLGSDGRIDWSEVPQGGYVVDDAGQAIKEPYTPPVGSVIDRFGAPNGRYTSPVIDGHPFAYDQRSLPYVEDPAQYHQYKVVGDMSDIRDYYDRAPASVRDEVDDYMIVTDKSWADLVSERGRIAPGFGDAGGGTQIQLPLPVNLLEKLELVKPIPGAGER